MVPASIFIPGIRVILELVHPVGHKYFTFIRGLKPNEYIIMDYPLDAASCPIFLKDNSPCVVRFLSQGKVYRFQSRVRITTRYPYPFIFIDYPLNIDHLNLRKTNRVPVRLPVKFVTKTPEEAREKHQEGIILDLSGDGCLLMTSEPMTSEGTLYLTFSLPNQDLISNLAAVIRRSARKDEGYHHGVSFPAGQDIELVKVRTYLDCLEALQLDLEKVTT
jgi:c-di-GMP-binding flagellar brake protein YcgR